MPTYPPPKCANQCFWFLLELAVHMQTTPKKRLVSMLILDADLVIQITTSPDSYPMLRLKLFKTLCPFSIQPSFLLFERTAFTDENTMMANGQTYAK